MSSGTVTRAPQPPETPPPSKTGLPPETTQTSEEPQPAEGAGRRRLRGRWRWLLISLGVLVVLVGAGWLLFFSSVFAAKQVTVSGLRELTASQVRKAAAVPLGEPLVSQDLQSIGVRATQIPQIEQVHVRRQWPNVIVITVTERRPLLGMPHDNGFLIIDRLGVAYETRPSLPTGVMLVRTDPANAPLLAELGTAAGVMPKRLREQVTTIMANTGDDITLILKSGVTVMWGDATRSQLKADVTVTLLKRKPKVSVDVSSPHNPAIR